MAKRNTIDLQADQLTTFFMRSYMDIGSHDLMQLNQLRNRLETSSSSDSTSVNIASLRAFEHLYPCINTLINTKYEYLSDHHREQYELRQKLKYSVLALLKSSYRSARDLLDKLFDEIPTFKLMTYPLLTVSEAHAGYFLPRYENELMELARGQFNNRNPIDAGLFITHPSLAELTEHLPDIAHKILPHILSDTWDAGFRAAAAQQLYLLGYQTPRVLVWRALGAFDMNDPALNSVDADTCFQQWTLHCVEGRGGSQRALELEVLEPYLKKRVRSYPDSELAEFAAKKWQGSSWRTKILYCTNGWKFTIQRCPYILQAVVFLPGGEVARDQIIPNVPKQLEWLDQTLNHIAPDAYSVSYKITYIISGESVLQQLLDHIRQLGVADEKDEQAES